MREAFDHNHSKRSSTFPMLRYARYAAECRRSGVGGGGWYGRACGGPRSVELWSSPVDIALAQHLNPALIGRKSIWAIGAPAHRASLAGLPCLIRADCHVYVARTATLKSPGRLRCAPEAGGPLALRAGCR